MNLNKLISPFLVMAFLARPTVAAELPAVGLNSFEFLAAAPKAARNYVDAVRRMLLDSEKAQQASPFSKVARVESGLSMSFFEAAAAQESTVSCNPNQVLGHDTCVFAGSISKFLPSPDKPNLRDCRFICPPASGLPKCEEKGTIACNPLVFVSHSGGVVCVPIRGSPTLACSKSDPKDAAFFLYKKLQTPEGRAAWERLQKELVTHCSHANWDEKNNTKTGACDLLARAVSDIKVELSKISQIHKDSATGEKTVCLFEFNSQDEHPATMKLTYGRNKDGREVATLYKYLEKSSYNEAGWVPDTKMVYKGCNPCTGAGANFSFGWADIFPSKSFKSTVTFTADASAPSTCGFDGYSLRKTKRLPVKELQDAGEIDQNQFLGDLDKLMSRQDLDKSTARVGRALSLLKAKRDCKNLSLVDSLNRTGPSQYSLTFKLLRNGVPVRNITSTTLTAKDPSFEASLSKLSVEQIQQQLTAKNGEPLDLVLNNACKIANSQNSGSSNGGNR